MKGSARIAEKYIKEKIENYDYFLAYLAGREYGFELPKKVMYDWFDSMDANFEFLVVAAAYKDKNLINFIVEKEKEEQSEASYIIYSKSFHKDFYLEERYPEPIKREDPEEDLSMYENFGISYVDFIDCELEDHEQAFQKDFEEWRAKKFQNK